jgi:hypothetical protein
VELLDQLPVLEVIGTFTVKEPGALTFCEAETDQFEAELMIVNKSPFEALVEPL